MNSKNSLIRMKVFLKWSLWLLFVALVVSLNSSDILKAQEEAEPPASAPTPAAQTLSVIATTDGEYPNVRVEVTELKRTSGNTVTLKFAIINDSSKEMGFSYDFVEEGKYGTIDFNSVGGVNLVDAAGKKKYLVLRDSNGKCVCSRSLKDVQPGSRASLYAKFPAPPEDVEKITIEIPHFIPMDDVPISK